MARDLASYGQRRNAFGLGGVLYMRVEERRHGRSDVASLGTWEFLASRCSRLCRWRLAILGDPQETMVSWSRQVLHRSLSQQ